MGEKRNPSLNKWHTTCYARDGTSLVMVRLFFSILRPDAFVRLSIGYHPYPVPRCAHWSIEDIDERSSLGDSSIGSREKENELFICMSNEPLLKANS